MSKKKLLVTSIFTLQHISVLQTGFVDFNSGYFTRNITEVCYRCFLCGKSKT